MTVSAGVTEFPGESFTVSKSNGQLFCNACCEDISLKKTIIEKNHVKSSIGMLLEKNAFKRRKQGKETLQRV